MKFFLNLLVIFTFFLNQNNIVYSSPTDEFNQNEKKPVYSKIDAATFFLTGVCSVNIYKYLGRHEFGSLLNVSKSLFEYINFENQEIWREHYFNSLGLERVGSEEVSKETNYKKLIQEYCKPHLKIIKKFENYQYFSVEYLSDRDDEITILAQAKKDHEVNKAIVLKYSENRVNIETLGLLNNGRWSRPLSTNSDCSTIVGFACDRTNNQISTAFRYTNQEGIKSLDSLNQGKSSRALQVNEDGSKILGVAHDGAQGNKLQLVEWRDGSIEVLEGIEVSTDANNISDQHTHVAGMNSEASVIVGHIPNPNDKNSIIPFKYSIKGDCKKSFHLALYKEKKVTYATCTNFDGSVIGGHTNGSKKTPKVAVIWDKTRIYSLDEYFSSKSQYFDRFQLFRVTTISTNGTKNDENLEFSKIIELLKKTNDVKALSPDGGDIIGNTRDGDVYVLHVPRLDFFTMK